MTRSTVFYPRTELTSFKGALLQSVCNVQELASAEKSAPASPVGRLSLQNGTVILAAPESRESR